MLAEGSQDRLAQRLRAIDDEQAADLRVETAVEAALREAFEEVALDLDFADLQRSDVRFLKVAADLLIEQLLDLDGASALPSLRDISAADFAGLTRRYGIELIAEKCESERQIVDILELDISMGQGHLFGEPRAIRDAILAEADSPSDFLQQSILRRAGGASTSRSPPIRAIWRTCTKSSAAILRGRTSRA